MMPECSHTGTPRHFHSSTTSGQASMMRLRTRASVSPRQSLSSLILASISREGESPPFGSFAPVLLFFMVAVAFFVVASLFRDSRTVRRLAEGVAHHLGTSESADYASLIRLGLLRHAMI